MTQETFFLEQEMFRMSKTSRETPPLFTYCVLFVFIFYRSNTRFIIHRVINYLRTRPPELNGDIRTRNHEDFPRYRATEIAAIGLRDGPGPGPDAVKRRDVTVMLSKAISTFDDFRKSPRASKRFDMTTPVRRTDRTSDGNIIVHFVF